MSNHHHNQPSDFHSLLGLGLLGGVLLLPPNLLMRLLRRLAILAGVFVAALTVIIGAYAAFTPAMPLCPDYRVPTIADSCKQRPRPQPTANDDDPAKELRELLRRDREAHQSTN